MIEVNVKYDLGHTIKVRIEKTELFCPCCGIKEVYIEVGDGDFYVGPEYYCVACNANFNLPVINNDT